MEDEIREIREIIAEAIGAASMCWSPSPMETTQVFNSTKAVEILNDTMNKLNNRGI